MNKSYFITATGTDIGKTWLSAGLVASYRENGVPVRALKPLMSGYDPVRHDESDAGRIGAAAADIDRVSPWRFAAALSPDQAAAKEGRRLDYAAVVEWCRREIAADAAADRLLLIEGVGGPMVPLDARHTVRDWIAALKIPTLLVGGSYLGAMSHLLTALAALREVGVVPALAILNESAGSTVSLTDTVASLTPHLGGVPLVVLRRDDTAGVAALAQRLLRRP